MRRILILTTALAAGACAKPAERPSTGAGAADSTPAAPAAAMPDNITPAPPVAAAPSLGRLMLGTWDIAAVTGGGPHLAISVDSASGPAFYGRVASALSGDVLLDVDRFRQFRGTVGPDSTFSVSIAWVERGPPAMVVRGKVSSTGWLISALVWGGEQMVVPGRTWTGRRAKL